MTGSYSTKISLPILRLIGGVIAILFTGDSSSISTLAGFAALFGVTVKNSIMLTSHYQNLV